MINVLLSRRKSIALLAFVAGVLFSRTPPLLAIDLFGQSKSEEAASAPAVPSISGPECAVQSQPCSGRDGLPTHKNRWRPFGFRCYPVGMQVMARLIPLLLLTLALTLPAAARSSERASAPIESSATIMQSAPLYGTQRTAMRCYRCKWQPCGVSAAACGASCDAASAITPPVIVPATTPRSSRAPSVFRVVRDHRGAPDPHPPRLIAIS